MDADTERRTFFPRFTIRAILLVVTLSAVLFVVVGAGFRGQMWAWGVTIGVVSLGVTALVHAACFGVAWCFGRLASDRDAAAGDADSPMQEATP